MTTLQLPSDREQRIANRLRDSALAKLDQMPIDEAASRLGLLPVGVDSLRARSTWSLEMAFRTCEALGIASTIAIERSVEQAGD